MRNKKYAIVYAAFYGGGIDHRHSSLKEAFKTLSRLRKNDYLVSIVCENVTEEELAKDLSELFSDDMGRKMCIERCFTGVSLSGKILRTVDELPNFDLSMSYWEYCL